MRAALWAVGLTALVMLLAWAALPIVLKKAVETQGSALLGRAVSVQSVHVNPLTLTLTIDGLQIAGPSPGAHPQLALAQAAVNLDLRSLIELAPVIEAVTLRGLDLRLARLAEGRYDVDDIIRRLGSGRPTAPDASPARFAVYNVDLQGGQIRFDDQPIGRVHELRELTLGIPFVSNLDEAVDVHVEPRLAFRLGDTRFDTGVQTKPFAQERAGKLTLKTGDLDLADWLAYLPSGLPVRPGAGRLAVDLSVQFKAPRGAAPEVTILGGAQGGGLTVLDEAGAPLVALDEWSVQLDELQPLRRRAGIRSARLEGLTVHAARSDQGQLNWLAAFARPASSAPGNLGTSSAAPPSAAWQLSLGHLVLKNSSIRWQDQAVRPAFQAALEGVALDVTALRWPVAEGAPPAKLSAEASLRLPTAAASPASAPQIQVRGEWSAASGQMQSTLSAWPVAVAAPYLGQIIRPRVGGVVTADATARWQGAPGAQPPIVSVAALSVDDLQATWPGERQPALAWKQLRLTDASLDPAQRQVRLGALALDQPRVRAHRGADGELDILRWDASPAADSEAAGTPQESAPPWALQLQEMAIANGQLAWRDDAAPEPVAVDLRRLAVTARGLRWPPQPDARATLQGSLQWLPPGGGTAGELAWRGDLALAPLAWRGRLKADHLPLQTVAAYGAGLMPVAVGRAEAGWEGQVAAGWSPAGLTLGMTGDARVDDLRLFARQAAGVRDGAELLTWQTLVVPGVQVALKPGERPSITLGEARLNDFYARLSVDETGRFNLAGLKSPAPAASASAPEASAPAASVPASAPAATGQGGVDFAIAGLQLSNGRVDFTDRFIRPNYSADLSALNGRLGGFRTGTREMAALDLKGRVAGTGQLDVRGALNPTAQPLALDIQARASELDLAPLSPYAGKYAGYAIERGKLSMDVAYRVEGDGRLDARNRIVLNQLTFGERIDSPDATKLPVLLAVALLKDNQGVIDLDLPIGGSINDPEFSVGRVVLKVIVNVLTKALTAPFALLAGGGEADLSVVEFRPGTAHLATEAGTSMDKVARALADRPALQMTVTGVVDPQAEREAIQSAWLEGRLALEWRKELARAGGRAEPGEPGELPAEHRARLLKRLYADTPLPNKPRNLVGMAKDLPPAEMEALLRASHVVTTDNARELALQRGLAVRDALLAKGLPPERLFLASPRLRAADADEASWTPRAQLSLGTP